MAVKWYKISPGIRYRKHPTRKHGVQYDKYYTIYYRLNGKQKEERVGWASSKWTLEKVQDLLNELKRNHRTGEGPQTLKERKELKEELKRQAKKKKARKKREEITFSQFFDSDYYPAAKDTKKSSSYLKEKQHVTKWIAPVIGDIPLKKISELNIERIKRNLIKAKRAPRTVQHVLGTVRQIWNAAKRDGLVTGDSPTKEPLKKVKFDNQRLRYLSESEAEALLNELKLKHQQLHYMTLLSLHCGLRAKEIFSLTWGDVSPKYNLITLRNTKSGKSRPAYPTEAVKDMLAGKTRGKRNELVFPDKKGKMYKEIPRDFSRIVKKLKFNDGVEDNLMKVVFHSCRHTFASWHVKAGTDLYLLQRLMGHSTIAVTERYSHVSDKTLKNAVSSFEKKVGALSVDYKEAKGRVVKL